MEKKKRFQIVTYFTDSGFDDKEDVKSIAEARRIVSERQAYRRVCGVFPTEEKILDYALVY